MKVCWWQVRNVVVAHQLGVKAFHGSPDLGHLRGHAVDCPADVFHTWISDVSLVSGPVSGLERCLDLLEGAPDLGDLVAGPCKRLLGLGMLCEDSAASHTRLLGGSRGCFHCCLGFFNHTRVAGGGFHA